MSKPVKQLLLQLQAERLPAPVQELMFAKEAYGRRWRADLAWPEHWLIVEVDGGVYTQGRHTRGRGYEEDCRKQAAAVLLGWRYLRVTPGHIRTGEARLWIKHALKNGDSTHARDGTPERRGAHRAR